MMWLGKLYFLSFSFRTTTTQNNKNKLSHTPFVIVFFSLIRFLLLRTQRTFPCRWLPEHPGGNNIIPKQAVNKDATVFFELYHASRKSFIYLEQFYIGELHPADLNDVPPAGTSKRLAKPSDGFLKQLSVYTKWRVTPDEVQVHKSFWPMAKRKREQ